MRTKDKILLAIADGKPRNCNEISTLVGKDSQQLGVHLFQMWQRGLIYRLDGLVNRRPHYYALEQFFESDVPPPLNEPRGGEITCRACNTSKPRTKEYFHLRSSNPDHVGTSKEFKSICKVCACGRARNGRPAPIPREKKEKVEVTDQRIVEKKKGNSRVIIFTDNWRHNKEGIAKRGFSAGYESALTKVF